MELTVSIPPLLLKPVQGKHRVVKGFYNCPVYLYPVRAAVKYAASAFRVLMCASWLI